MRDGKQSYDDYKVDAVAYLQPNWIIFSFMMFCSFISGLMDYHILVKFDKFACASQQFD